MNAAPNPSAGQVMLLYQLPRATMVTIEVFAASGSLVRRLAGEYRAAGYYSARWDGRDDFGRELPSGVYLIRVTTTGGTATGRAVLTR